MDRREQHIGMSVAEFTSNMGSSTYAELANGTLNMLPVTSTGLNIQSDTLGTRNQSNVRLWNGLLISVVQRMI